MLGLFHLGVVKELLSQELLPRVILGNKSGAVTAAMVGAFSDEELLKVLADDMLDSIEFDARSRSRRGRHSFEETLLVYLSRNASPSLGLVDPFSSLLRDVTFEEAYERTKKPLNITIPCDDISGIPEMLNYITSPNVVVRTAAMV